MVKCLSLAEQNHITFQNKYKTYNNLILQSLAKTKEKQIYQREVKHMVLTSMLAFVTLMYAYMNSAELTWSLRSSMVSLSDFCFLCVHHMVFHEFKA